jgi:hypothetical protein
MTPSNIALFYITPPAIHGRATGNIVHIMESRISRLLVLSMGLCAASQGACGGGAAKAGDASARDGLVTIAGRNLPDAGPAIDAAHPGDFISADVDGTTVRAELMPAAGTMGLTSDALIWASAGTTSTTLGWNFYVPNAAGTFSCPPSWMALFEPGRIFLADAAGSCSITVTQAAPALGDVLEGTFSATLKTTSSTPQTAVVTNGAFHVTRNFE